MTKNMKKYYPVGKLDDIYIHFNHYNSYEDAIDAWERRKKRIVENKLFISSTTNRECAIRFTELPIDNKLIFVPKGINIEHDSIFSINYDEKIVNRRLGCIVM